MHPGSAIATTNAVRIGPDTRIHPPLDNGMVRSHFIYREMPVSDFDDCLISPDCVEPNMKPSLRRAGSHCRCLHKLAGRRKALTKLIFTFQSPCTTWFAFVTTAWVE